MQNMEEYVFGGTEDISISACPMLVESEMADASTWGYYICFENNSDKKIQLIGKNWNITDDMGNIFHDDSAGFKGEIPELEPGECFEFTSMACLPSSNGIFYGSCTVIADDEVIDVKMPTMYLNGAKKGFVTLN